MRLLAFFLSAATLALVASPIPGGQPDPRQQLQDPKPLVRLQAALTLVQQLDEQAIGVLIDLLAELPPTERRQAEQALQQLAGDWAPNPALTGDDELSRKIRREVWAGWWKTFDGPTLLAAFHQRTLSREEAAQAETLIAQLGDASAAKRERASAELIAQGSKVVGLLRAAKSPDAEHARRVDICLKDIAQAETKDKLPPAAVRLLAARKPAGATEALLGYLPYTDDRAVAAEIVQTLTRLVGPAGKEDGAILSALSDPLPVRRIAAAEALAGAGRTALPAFRKLLTDAMPEVRLRAAIALVYAQDKAAVPALIALLDELPRSQAWEAEDLLQRLAGDKAPAGPSSDDVAARTKLRDDWQAWWKEHGARVDLAGLDKASGFGRLTVVAELAGNGKFDNPFLFAGGGKKGAANPGPAIPGAAKDRLVGIDRNGQRQWQIENLDLPIDFQLLPGGRVLIAEYASMRVTERDLTGKILWQTANLPGAPVSVQRLANGNTFIALYNTQANRGGSMVEVDRTGKTVAAFDNPAGGPAAGPPVVRAAFKMASGQAICLVSSGMCIRLDPTGKEINRFAVPLFGGTSVVIVQMPQFVGNIDVTAKGHVIVAQNDNTVAEYDPAGKMVWQVQAKGNRATRLANGNTLVASMADGVTELDSTGKTVRHYQPPAGFQAVRARQESIVNLTPPQ